MNPEDLGGVRHRAWATRRSKYGPSGHARGAYHRRPSITREAIEQARDEISSARRSCQILLPEPQAHRAIDCLDRADHLLGGPLQPSLRFGRCQAPEAGGCTLDADETEDATDSHACDDITGEEPE